MFDSMRIRVFRQKRDINIPIYKLCITVTGIFIIHFFNQGNIQKFLNTIKSMSEAVEYIILISNNHERNILKFVYKQNLT